MGHQETQGLFLKEPPLHPARTFYNKKTCYKWEEILGVGQNDLTFSQKFLEVQEPFYKKVPGRRRHPIDGVLYLIGDWQWHLIAEILDYKVQARRTRRRD
jgi:hypothetical protein